MARPREFDDDEVIERAMQAFWTNGYHATSPAQLAEATGVAKGSLYNAFGSKRALFERSLGRYHENTTALAHALMAAPGSTCEALRAALRAVVDADLSATQRRGCLVGNTAIELAGDDPQIARTVRGIQDETIGWFVERLEQGQREGDVPTDLDVRGFAEFLATTLAGLRVMVMTFEAPALHRIIDSALLPLTTD